jgi:hypothetical protein
MHKGLAVSKRLHAIVCEHPSDTAAFTPRSDLRQTMFSSKRVNYCSHAHTFALPSPLPRAMYKLPTRYLPDLRRRRHFSVREKRSVDTDRFEGIAQSSGMSSGTLESSGGGGGGGDA